MYDDYCLKANREGQCSNERTCAVISHVFRALATHRVNGLVTWFNSRTLGSKIRHSVLSLFRGPARVPKKRPQAGHVPLQPLVKATKPRRPHLSQDQLCNQNRLVHLELPYQGSRAIRASARRGEGAGGAVRQGGTYSLRVQNLRLQVPKWALQARLHARWRLRQEREHHLLLHPPALRNQVPGPQGRGNGETAPR